MSPIIVTDDTLQATWRIVWRRCGFASGTTMPADADPVAHATWNRLVNLLSHWESKT